MFLEGLLKTPYSVRNVAIAFVNTRQDRKVREETSQVIHQMARSHSIQVKNSCDAAVGHQEVPLMEIAVGGDDGAGGCRPDQLLDPQGQPRDPR